MMKDYDCCFTKDNKWFRYRAAAIIAEDAVKREAFEETGIAYDIDRLAVIHERLFMSRACWN